MTTASDLLRKLWTKYINDIEIPRIKALLSIKKWPEYKMSIYVFPINLAAFFKELEGYARGGGGENYGMSIFKKYIVNHYADEETSIVKFVEDYFNKEFGVHIVKLSGKVETDNGCLSFVATFKSIDSDDLEKED